MIELRCSNATEILSIVNASGDSNYPFLIFWQKITYFAKQLHNLLRSMASKLILIYEDMRLHMIDAATEADIIIQELRNAQK